MASDRKPKPVRAWAIACRDGSALHIGTVSVTRRDAWGKFDAFWTRESHGEMVAWEINAIRAATGGDCSHAAR